MLARNSVICRIAGYLAYNLIEKADLPYVYDRKYHMLAL